MGETVGISSTSSQETITENIDSFTDIIEPTTSDAVIETALKIGDFKAMGLANFTPVGLIEEFFEILHVSTGLPWWGTITLATLILRLGFFPLVIKNQKLVAKFTEIQPEAQKLMDQIKKARSKGDQYTLMNKTVELKQLYSDNNINSILSPFLLPLIQMPFFISFFISLRKMAELPVPGFTQGGILWFKDLSVPDPQVILPFLVSFGFILTLELGAESGALKNSQGTGLRWFFRILSITSIFFTMQLPSAVLYYFFCANTLAFTQSQLLKNKRVRNYFGLPKLKINDIVKQKSFMEQWREWNASASAEVNKNKKRKKRL
ncbi:60Kd inner membrane protein [Glomus cerebriforme]|uniref:60Kd inner membrane protein n=1 Tax=Glomus cerebriforme TaxID=658196 RepID=A0A397TK29_9GLOM|nr:60Kd inner membrane protein [Glomus cerebriforme]